MNVHMLRVVLAVLLTLPVILSPGAGEASGQASQFIDLVAREAIAIGSDGQISDAARERAYRALFNKAFAVKGISRFVLGRYWRQASAQQRRRFMALFEDFVVQTYGRRFDTYNDEIYDLAGERDQGRKGVVVLMRVKRTDGLPIMLQWRVKKSKSSSRFKIIDVVVEGVSMSVTQRSSFASAIANHGGDIDRFLDDLSRKVKP